MTTQDLKDRTAVITGAGRGIGAACAALLAEHGAAVVVADIDLPRAAGFANSLRARGFRAVPVEVDVASKGSIDAMVAASIEQFRRIDILVNNAGVIDATPIPEMSVDGWDRVLDINLRGVHLCSQAVVEHMVKNRSGKIVNVASLAGHVGGLRVSPNYSASKAGVMCLAKAYARYCARFGITVNAVAPGFIMTDMTVNSGYDPETVPLKRLGTPEDVANAVYFLASSMSDYVTGHTIDVNGGVLMR
jgi:3-oxoacyl-[acyl-carrier protein] reductase